MSIGASRSLRSDLPPQWARLEQAAEDAAVAVAFWKRRAHEAEEEVSRLRRGLEELAARRDAPHDLEEELRRLRAENAALRSRMLQAHRRVGSLLKRLATLGIEI